MSADPRVEALIAWAWQRTDKLAGPPAATLVDTPSSPAAAAELASAAAGAYACRAVRAGNRIVALLGELGEPGARELVRLRDSVRYRDARNTIEKTLRRLSHELRIPAGELEDRFEGIASTAHSRPASRSVGTWPSSASATIFDRSTPPGTIAQDGCSRVDRPLSQGEQTSLRK
jgi:hypothetical protein